MGHKRKRSTDSSPLSVSSFGGFAPTPEAQSPTPIPDNCYSAMDVEMDVTFSSRFTPINRGTTWSFENAPRVKESDWGNRTRKRVRDNRPDEHIIHETTINKLFAAQREHPHAQPILSDTLAPHPPVPAVQKLQKSTLHSFWKQLPTPPTQSPPLAVQQHHIPPTWNVARCEDCDAPLQSEADGADVDMDMDNAVAGREFACHGCGRNVCGTCAVAGSTRHCLPCATSGRNSGRWW